MKAFNSFPCWSTRSPLSVSLDDDDDNDDDEACTAARRSLLMSVRDGIPCRNCEYKCGNIYERARSFASPVHHSVRAFDVYA